uniref:Coiled-coil domain containing 84 n=1 Tax=Cyprinus carpio TaxID=7962 RepID=A0A8C2E8Y9_CYPCA
MGAFYCSICRKTDFSGKGHIYGKSHQSKLKVILVKFTEKVKEARRTIKNPQVEKYSPHHEEKFWCYCCALEVQKHVTDSNISVLYGGLLEHMSTPEHRTNTHKFWWDNKAEPKLRDKFIITEEETERFKSEVSKALEQFEEKEDVLIKQQAAAIRSQEQHRLEVLQSLSEVCFPGMLQAYPYLSTQEQINRICYFSGNVHTGAVPPWLLEEPDEASSSGQQEMGPSLQEFLKHKEQEKLKKLPPNRVGANFDHGSHTAANWLPSFGRVWNSGRRWQSRHQFREEEAKTRGKRKREDVGKATKKQKDLSNGEL